MTCWGPAMAVVVLGPSSDAQLCPSLPQPPCQAAAQHLTALSRARRWQSCSCCRLPRREKALLAGNWPHTSREKGSIALKGFRILPLLEAH